MQDHWKERMSTEDRETAAPSSTALWRAMKWPKSVGSASRSPTRTTTARSAKPSSYLERGHALEVHLDVEADGGHGADDERPV